MLTIGMLPVYTIGGRLVGKEHPHLVSYVEQVVGAGQQHLRVRSRAGLFKQDMLGAGQGCLRNEKVRHMD